MNIDIHNDDELYRQAYERLEADPAPQVWEKVSAALNNNAAQYYRRKFIGWRITSLLLLTAFIATIAGGIWFFNSNQPANNNNKTISQNNKQQTNATTKHTTIAETTNTNKQQAPLPTGTGDKPGDAGAGEQSAEPVQNNNLAQTTPPVQVVAANKILTGGGQTKAAATSLIPSAGIAATNFNANRPAWYTAKQGTIARLGSSYPILSPGAISVNMLPAIALSTPAIPGNAGTGAKKIAISHKLFKRGIALTAYSSVDFSGYSADDGHGHAGGQQGNMHEFKERERPEAGFSAGLLATLPLNEKLQFKTGLVYSNTIIDIGEQKLYASVDGNNSIGYKLITSAGYAYIKPRGITPATGDSALAHRGHVSQQYISVPLMAGYTVYNNRRLAITPLLGVSANILLGTHVTTALEGVANESEIKLDHLNGQRQWYPSFMVAAAAQYTISSRLSVNLLPSFKHAINTATKGDIIKSYPYSVGLGLGITYKF